MGDNHAGGMTVSTAPVEETKAKSAAAGKVQGDSSKPDNPFKPEKIMQLAILGITLHLVWNKLYYSDGEYRVLFHNGLIVAVAVLAGAFSTYRHGEANSSLLPKFEIIYLVYLTFMMVILFDRAHASVNFGLVLNCINMPEAFKLGAQAIFVLLNESPAELDEKLRHLLAICLNYALYTILANISQLKSLDAIDCNLFSILLTNVLFIHEPVESIYFQVLRGTMWAFLTIVGVNYTIDLILAPLLNTYVKSAVLFSIFIIGFPALVRKLLTIDNHDSLEWLISYITTSYTRQRILTIWLASLLTLIPNVLIFKSSFTLNSSRKIWHFLVLILIAKPFEIDPNFVKISLAGSIVLFLSVEYLRYLKLEPIGGYLDSKLRLFADYRDDKGPIIVSYIYLILGIATPLLINNSPVGLISLGVGDSLASIVGSKWGRKVWPGTNKTLEGTAAFIVSTVATAAIFKRYLGYFKHISLTNLSVICTLCGLLEGNSSLNDNILIPAFMLITEELFTD
ncbi:hypothetical protein HG536_0G01270 [Torulaspora globosa]|uniref:dolichol kinase n=1 Tax=Torulaspora globosa TaxID=48254 RepID=A0A7G3ZL82_9SACH|nr:uncharacterized protein HG536_0G01270 [Torulaspora globosa]QLL34268.1 hypothetical protein HG536_0G01270 [Torulaspora globosa]